MDTRWHQQFIDRWHLYFGDAPLPVALWYSDHPVLEAAPSPPERRCFVDALMEVVHGRPLAFDEPSVGCPGGKRYLGFTQTLSPTIHYFLSCGIPGRLEGERYKKTPEMARRAIDRIPPFTAPARYLECARWDQVPAGVTPDLVVFFAPADVVAGLFTLANFDRADTEGVIAPFGAACSSIVRHPWLEREAPEPRAVLGCFDPSARPHLDAGWLSFAVPMARFESMANDMDESFLIAPAWQKVRERMPGGTGTAD